MADFTLVRVSVSVLLDPSNFHGFKLGRSVGLVEAYQSMMAHLSRVSDGGLDNLHAQLEEALPDYESLSRDQETTDTMT